MVLVYSFIAALLCVVPVLQPVPVQVENNTIETADDLLDALEDADANLQDFSARLKYIKEDVLTTDRQERRGTIHYQVVPESGARQFAVLFTTLQLDERKFEEQKDYIFDGRYLVERITKERQFFKREVVRPGEEYDPLSIDGPFPLPIGQKKKAILRRFDTELITPDTEGRLKGFYHLKLTARDRTDEGDELDTVNLWYDPDTLLPAKAVVADKTGDLSIMELAKIESNTGVKPDVFSTKLPEPRDGWMIEITNLQREPEG